MRVGTWIWSRVSAHHCKSIQDILIQMTAKGVITSAIHGAARRRTDMKRLTYVKQKSRWNYGKNPTQYSSRETFQSVCDRLGKIEDILGDEYDLDRLRELAEADREDGTE